MSRSMIKLIHADGFFPNNDAENLKNLAKNMNFIDTKNGKEVPNFNLIFPDSEIIFNKVLGERVMVDISQSGILRKPNNNLICFQDFESTEEWCFMVALEPTTVNFWYHTDNTNSLGDLAPVNARNALTNNEFNFRNLFEWKIHTNILLEQNQCLFYRPWTFHSLEDGLIQHYRLTSDNGFRILIMGYPGSSKKNIAKKLNTIIDNSTLLVSDEQRRISEDIDYTMDGQLRHCYRMLNLARKSKDKLTLIDMACPLPKMRQILNCDVVVWVTDRLESRFEDLNKIYSPPLFFDIECKDSEDSTINEILKIIIRKSNKFNLMTH